MLKSDSDNKFNMLKSDSDNKFNMLKSDSDNKVILYTVISLISSFGINMDFGSELDEAKASFGKELDQAKAAVEKEFDQSIVCTLALIFFGACIVIFFP